jgi:hypothetical protein
MITHYMTIRAPFGEMIMSGRKDVETRLRRISDKFIGQRVGIYEPERKMFIGSVLILGQKIYPTAAAFRKDYSRHLVKQGSQYDIKKGGTKIGIILDKPSRDIFGQRPKKFAPSTIVKNPVPPASVARAAKRGLIARKKYRRGGTAVGVARARDLSRRANVSMRTIARMSSYFARHRASRYESAKRISDPTSAARIADDLWGGSAGFRWAKKVRENPAKTIKAYHGSNENFNSFSKAGKGTYDDSLGFFFTSSKFDAGFYGDIVYSVSLSFKNPYIVKWSDITEELGGDRQLSPWSFGMKTLISKGYDSAIVMADAKSKKYGEEYDDHEFQYNQYIAFNSKQIRIIKRGKAE